MEESVWKRFWDPEIESSPIPSETQLAEFFT